MALLYSARTWDELIYRDELLEPGRQNDGFHLAFALTRDASGRAGHYSRRIDRPMVSDLLAQLAGAAAAAHSSAAPTRFVEAATQAAIAAGLPPRPSAPNATEVDLPGRRCHLSPASRPDGRLAHAGRKVRAPWTNGAG